MANAVEYGRLSYSLKFPIVLITRLFSYFSILINL